MTDCISFPLNGNFFAKIRILCFHHYQPAKQRRCKSKKNLWLMHYQNWIKMSCHLESKSSSTFNFIKIFVLELCNNSQDRIIKMTQHVTSHTRRVRYWKKKTQMEAMWYYAAKYIKISIMILRWNPWIPNFICSVFYSIECIAMLVQLVEQLCFRLEVLNLNQAPQFYWKIVRYKGRVKNGVYRTLKVRNKNCSRRHFNLLLFFLSKKIRLEFSFESSA